MPHILPYLVPVLLYVSVAAHQWRRPQGRHAGVERAAVAVGLALHGWLLAMDTFVAGGVSFGLGNAVSAIFWLTVLIYWLASLRLDLHALQAFILPPAALAVLLAGLLPQGQMLPYTNNLLFHVHLAIALLGYSLFTFAALHAGLMALAERSLHLKKSPVRLPDFPPIMPMERLLFQIIGAGFVLLTLTVASGIVFTEQLLGQPLQLNHKNVFSLAAWLIFGALLWGRHAYGWRGRVAVRWTLAGFGVLLLAYVGSKFALEVILGR